MRDEYALFDLDGTLLDISTCTHLIGDWDAFHEATLQCPPVERIVDLANTLNEAGIPVMVVTGKPETYRQAAMAWMLSHCVPCDTLLMRPHLDTRSDAEVKVALVAGHFGPNWQRRVLFAIEDRDKMVEAWRANGILTLQCAASLY